MSLSLDQGQVRVAGAGGVYVAGTDAAWPTNESTALDPDVWTNLGYCTEDGVTFTFSRTTTDLNAWQGDKLRVLTTAEPASIAFNLMQTSRVNLEVALGGGTTTTISSGHYKYEPPAKGTNTERRYIVEFVDGSYVYRYCIVKAQVEGEVTFQLVRTDAVKYAVQLGILDNGDNAKFFILSNDPALAPGS